MAEAVAAFYAVESVVEGVAVGALAVSGSTVPLRATFRRVRCPEAAQPRGTTAFVLRNKIYLVDQRQGQDTINRPLLHVLSLPSDYGVSRTQANEPVVVDYQKLEPARVESDRPLSTSVTDTQRTSSVSGRGDSADVLSEVDHNTVAVNDRLYVLGGQTKSGTPVPLDTLLCVDTLRGSFDLVHANPSKCTEGVPSPRTNASSASSPLPPAVTSIAAGDGPTIDSHGTIFLHGGYNSQGKALHDTWTFDLGTKAWHKFPSIQELQLEGLQTTGKIAYVDGRLWYVNGSVVMYLDLSEHDPTNMNIPSDPSILSTGRVGSGQWQVAYPPVRDAEDKGAAAAAASASNSSPSEIHRILPITTGAGRQYLLCTTATKDMYTFQIPSTPKTLASVKDSIRDSATKILPDSWKSGKHEWARVDIVEASMQDGVVEGPAAPLSDFLAAVWDEQGDKVVFWRGGMAASDEKEELDERENEGWLVTLE